MHHVTEISVCSGFFGGMDLETGMGGWVKISELKN